MPMPSLRFFGQLKNNCYTIGVKKQLLEIWYMLEGVGCCTKHSSIQTFTLIQNQTSMEAHINSNKQAATSHFYEDPKP